MQHLRQLGNCAPLISAESFFLRSEAEFKIWSKFTSFQAAKLKGGYIEGNVSAVGEFRTENLSKRSLMFNHLISPPHPSSQTWKAVLFPGNEFNGPRKNLHLVF